ncbi:MAG: hypothetical protein JWM99_4146, partial [Verrucomicrobiales bacterium]|nr:hypothetical protein [Verrucomicrobiales bacterium]
FNALQPALDIEPVLIAVPHKPQVGFGNAQMMRSIKWFDFLVRDIALGRAFALLIAVQLLVLLDSLHAADSTNSAESATIALIKPAKSTDTGLLLQPSLDLSKFSTDDFTEISSTVGPERIHKKWTNAVVTLPPHGRSGVSGLTEQEVKDYMVQVRDLFNKGDANPMSDVGLISTQEDVIRRPMLNHVSAFSNAVARVYLLVQKTSTDKGWGYFSIVQDLTVDPPLDYFADMNGKGVKFEGINCYKCHSSGPLAIHPARADLVSDAPLAAAISKHIAKQPLSRFYFPENEKRPDYGTPLALEFCTKCHDTDGVRLPLFKVHSHPIRILVDFGYMPPKHPLTADQIAELKTWLDRKP